jgi:cell wall-associated NlpC family hydrolase
VDRKFGVYQHVGVYLGGGQVIHVREKKDPGFVTTSFKDFLKIQKFRLVR